MYTLRQDQVERVVRHYVVLWGKKAVIPGGDWSVTNIARWIIYYSNKYKIDILLPLAQAVVECHFGAAPAATRSRRTLNIYNVGNVDTGKDEQQKSWKAGIERYCRVMANEYNWHDDPAGYVTLQSMIQHDFCRPNGGRYATAPDYTKQVASIAKSIQKLVEVA